jgi:hypothetical protein
MESSAASARLSVLQVLILLAMAFIAIAVLWTVPLSNDVSYQYWVARQLRHGADFGRDIVEVNPPLWFWEAALVSMTADALGLGYEPLIVVVMTVRAAFTAVLVMMCLPTLSPERRVVAGSGLMIMLCILPVRDLGQRDVIMILGAIPYAALAALRRDGARVPVVTACLIGLLAGYGIALKPHFLLMPILLESWLFLALRRGYRPFRPETSAMAAVGAAYLIAVIVFAPNWLGGALHLARQSYGAFGPPLSGLVLAQPYAIIWLIAATILVARWSRLESAARAAAVLALACAASYFVQGKGFSYHAAPLTIALLWALWLAVCEGRAIGAGVLRVMSGALIAATCAMAWMIGPYRPDDLGAVTKRLDKMPPGSAFAVISAHSWDAFPRVEDQRLVWPFRAASLWTIPAIVQTGEVKLRDSTFAAIADDLSCHPPHAILIDDAERAPDTAGRGFNYEKFIRQDRRIAALLAGYRVTARHGDMTFLETERPQKPFGQCRPVSTKSAIMR